MKRIFVLAGACVLVLAFGLRGISFSEDKTSNKAAGNTPLPARQGEKATTPGKDSRKFDNAVIAKVNGADILMRDLIVEMNEIGPQFIKDETQKTRENVRKVKTAALGILIFRELAIQEAGRQGMTIKPKAVDEARKQLKQKLGSEDNYRKYLQQMDLDEISLERQLKRDILFGRITKKEIFQKSKANDQASVEARKTAWENGLKNKAKIELMLSEVEKKIKEESGKQKKEL
ncbi:MAG: SurA N-terminal domain-containing protein [Thermodesulfovibrionales bacterium]